MSDLKIFREKTVSRIIDKRREYQQRQTQEKEEERKRDTAFRRQWLEEYKQRRSKAIIDAIDHTIINNAIPDTIHHSNKLSFRHQKQNNEEELRKLTTGLDDHLTGHDQNTLIRRDSGQYTVNIQNGSSTLFEFKSGEKKKSLADCFLRNAVSQHLYIHKRAKVDLQETLLLQQQPQQQPGSLTNGIAFLPDNNSIHNNSSSNNLSVNNTNSSNGTTTAVALGRKTNDIQIAELLKDLLNANSDPLRKKVSVGLMKSLYLLSQRSGWSDIRVSGNTVTNSRNSSRVTSPRHNSDPNANNTNPSASPAKPRSDHHKPTTNIFHTSLIDGCFVVGADKRTILDIVRSKRPSSSSSMINDDSSHGSDAKRGQSSNKNKGTMEDLSKVIAQPSVLYHSDSNESAEMLELLPQYCFPSGVEVNVQEPVRMVKPPLTMPASMMFPGDVSKKDKKKSRVFFPSDYSMGGGGGGGGGSSNQTEGGNMVRSNSIDAMRPPPIRPLNPGSVPNAAPPSQPPAEKTTSFRAHTLASALNTFVLILGDHTSQRFCLGLQIPVSFTDGESGLLIDTIYTFCILTRLSFFNYLFYVILKLDEEKSILVFRELLPTYDANFPIHPDLKMIDELVSKLNKIMVPIYPFFVLKHIKASGTNDSQSPPPSSSSPMEPYFTYLPNIRLTLKLKNAEVDVIDFNRAFYQAFYTNLGITIDEGDASLIEAAIRSHEKTIVANFTPSTSHKQEREKEESFFTLQWALPTLLRHLPLDQIILALGCAVSEMNIIVKHKDMNIVSSVILSLMHLLKPLKWCSPVIVSLPDHLSDVLESPVPIMIGVQKLPANFVLMENCVVIDPLERIVHLNPNDVVKSHTILLPSASRVVHALSSHAETILVFARKQKALKFKKLTVGQSFYGRNNQLDQNMKSKSAENGNNKESEGKTMKLNIPIELQINAEDCGHYLGAIKQFSNVVQNHILAVVNTAIQIQHDENREARHKRRVVKPVKSTKTAVAPSTKDSQLNGSVGGVSADLVVTKAAATTPPNNSTTTTSELESTGNGTLSTRPTSSNMKQDGSTGQADQPLSIKPSNPPAASTSNRSQSPNGVLNREARDRSSLESGRISVGSNKSSSRTSSPTQRPPSPVPTAGQPHAKEGGLISNVTVRRKKTNTAHSGAAKRAVTLPNSPLSISSLPPPKSKDKMPISSSDPRPQSMPRDMNITHEYKTLLTNVGITTPDNTNIWGSASPSVSSKRAQPLESITVISPGQGSTASGTPSKQSPPLVERVVEKVTDKQSVPETKVPLEITVPIVGGSPNKVNEQMSDVTSTDMAMEEKSIGASPSVSASISSGASSLPSLASDAPMLALKDIGQTGLKFVKKLVETQMYSNYCQWNKSSSCMTTDQDNLHQLTMYTSPVHGGNGRCSTMVDVLTPGVSIMPSRVPSPINDHQSMEDEEETKEEFDSVVDLFVITLTGSLSEGIDKVNNQWEVYYHLYGDNPQIDWIQLSESTKDADYILKATQKVFRNSRILRKYIEKRIIANYESSSSDGSQVKFHENDFLICNGLLCHGFCNTASCTDICANIWQRKVQKLRRQQAAFNILTRKVVGGKEIGESNHHDTLLLTQQAKIEYVTSSGARLEASKHGRETESQFHLRKAVIASAMTTTTTTSSSTSRKHCRSEDDIISDDHHHHHHQPVNHHHHHHHHHRRNRKDKKRRKYDHDHDKKIRAPMYGGHPYHQARENNGDRKMRTFANTDDPYVLALAKHFAKKEVNYIRKLRRRCYARIERFLRSYITYYRRLRFHRSVIYLQAAFRGYLVRANLENLVECLLERKRARLMARIRIRNFLRYQADSIIRLLNRRMEERARKLRSQSSIPIATSTTTVTSSNINMNRAASSSVLMTKSSKVDVSNGLLAESHGIITGNTGSIHSATTSEIKPSLGSAKAPRPMPPPIRYLNEPSLHEMRNAVMATNSTSSKQHGGVSGIALPVTPPSSSTSILSDVKQKDQQQGSPEMEAMPTVHKRGPMTEKAMEFLQFGKIVRKSSTSSGFLHRNSIPNKKSDASVTSLVTTSSTAVTVLGGHDNNNVVTQGASVTPSSSPATATPVVPAVANNGTGALTSSPTSSSTMPERRPSWTLSSISATGSNLFSGISPAPSPHSAKELSVGEIVAGNSCRASPVDSIHSQPPPPSPHSTDDPILQESRREMFMAVTSPTTFPLLPDEYDSNEEDDAQYITLKQQREAKRKFRNQRISRRFSASYTNSNPNNSQGTSTLDSIFNVKGHNGTAAVDSFIRLSVSESLDALSMDGHLKSSSMSSRIKPAVLDLTKLRDQGSLGTADSRDSKGSGGEESSRDRDASKRHSNGLGGSGQGSGHCSETERGSNHSLGERCESLISDEDTIMSASQSVLTSQTPIDIRYKRSTPIGRYTASKNIALHNMVGLNSSRRSKQGGGSNHRNLRPDSTSSDHSLQDSIDARMILGQQHQQQQRGGGGSGGNKLLPFMEESTRSRGDQSVVGNGGEGGKGPATSLVEAAGNSLARLSGRFSSPIRGNTSQQQSTSISPLKSGGERSNMDGMTSSPFSMNLHVSSRGETSSPLPPPPLPSGASPVIEKRRSIKLDTSNNDLDSHSTEDEQVDFNPSLKRDEDNIMSTFQVYPLKTLGRVAMELLNRQQLVIIKRMWKMLRDGVSVIKHGRSGAPKMKALLCDIAMTKLYWKPPGSKADPDMDDHEDEDEDEDDFRGKGDDHQQLLSNQPTPVSRESTGFSFLPHGRLSVFGGRKGRRSSTFSAQGNKRMIYFKSILSISDQCDSVVFKRSANKGYLNNEHTCTITMETPDRTLDIEVDEDVCQDLLHGLQILVTYYQSLLPGRHSSTAADVDLHYIKRPRNDSVMTNTPAYSFF